MNLKELIAKGASEAEILAAGGTLKDAAQAAKFAKANDALETKGSIFKTGCGIKSVNEDDRTLVGIASTGAVDRDFDILKVDGWKLDNFNINPVMPWSHQAGDLPIAKIIKIWIEGEKLMFKAKFPTKEVHKFADTVFQLFKEGFLNTFSVGFRGLEWEPNEHGGLTFTDIELLEISAVTVPANPEAVAKAAAKTGLDKKDVQKVLMIEKGADTPAKKTEPTESAENKSSIKTLLSIVQEKKELLEKSHDELKTYRKATKRIADFLGIPKRENEINRINETSHKVIAMLAQRLAPSKSTNSKTPEATPRSTVPARPALTVGQLNALVKATQMV